MASRAVHACQCRDCRSGEEHPERQQHHQMNLLLSRLDEQQRRWYVALESKRIGHGGDTRLAEITGMGVRAIRRGRRELDAELAGRPSGRVRLPGGGRHPVEQDDPEVETALIRLVTPETAGDPMGPGKWTRRSVRSLSKNLAAAGHTTSRTTVGRLLKKLGYSLKVNAKRKEAKSSHPDRDEQFQHIDKQRQAFQSAGQPVISVDTKKKS